MFWPINPSNGGEGISPQEQELEGISGSSTGSSDRDKPGGASVGLFLLKSLA
jgi:hypothetical protein